MQMHGLIANYGTKPSQIVHLSGEHKRHLVLVGGMTAGLLPVPFAKKLAGKLEAMQWTLVQAQLQTCFQVSVLELRA
jgi:hypothetical protein